MVLGRRRRREGRKNSSSRIESEMSRVERGRRRERGRARERERPKRASERSETESRKNGEWAIRKDGGSPIRFSALLSILAGQTGWEKKWAAAENVRLNLQRPSLAAHHSLGSNIYRRPHAPLAGPPRPTPTSTHREGPVHAVHTVHTQSTHTRRAVHRARPATVLFLFDCLEGKPYATRAVHARRQHRHARE